MREYREYYEREYYSRKSLEDSMRNCCYCLIAFVVMAVAYGIYSWLK